MLCLLFSLHLCIPNNLLGKIKVAAADDAGILHVARDGVCFSHRYSASPFVSMLLSLPNLPLYQSVKSTQMTKKICLISQNFAVSSARIEELFINKTTLSFAILFLHRVINQIFNLLITLLITFFLF